MLCIYNAIIVNEGSRFVGSVLVEGEIIRKVIAGEGRPAEQCDEWLDAQGCYLIPGVIDDHVHFRDPGLTHKADMATETAAAAAGGVTSFMDMPNCNPQTTTLEALDNKFVDAATKCVVNYSFYFGATNNNADMLSQLDKTHVCGVKLFMGASTGNMLVDRMDALRKIFSGAGMLIAVHCEDQQVIRRNTERIREQYGDDPDIRFHPVIRSEEACYQSSSLAVQLAKKKPVRGCTFCMSVRLASWSCSKINRFQKSVLVPKRVFLIFVFAMKTMPRWEHASSVIRASRRAPIGMRCARRCLPILSM